MNQEFEETSRNLFESLLAKSYEVEEKEEPIQAYYMPPEIDETGELPIFEEEDRDILMHRDAHFSGSFDLMLEHYEDEGLGAILDTDPEHIQYLQHVERQLGRDLAPFVLQGVDAEKIAESRKLYRALRDQIENPKSAPAIKLISELILDEGDLDKRAAKVAKYGPKIVPYLIQLLETPIFYDPLFPGYGQAPLVASLALGKLKAESAIKALFQLIGNDSFDIESAILQSLALIGDPAKAFCIAQLQSRPITKNNERAAVLASHLSIDPDIIISELEDPLVQKIPTLATYLVLALSELTPAQKARLEKMNSHLPSQVREELNLLLRK